MWITVLDNREEIAPIICSSYNKVPGSVTYRINPFVASDVIEKGKQHFRKPFFSSWADFLCDKALSDEAAFKLFAEDIFLTTLHKSTGKYRVWNGYGSHLHEITFASLTAFQGYASDALMGVCLEDKVFERLQPHLEAPRTR